MKKNNIIMAAMVVMPVAVLTGCLKKIDIPQSNTAEVVFTSSGAKFVTADITVNPKDSIFFNYTITSPKDMKYVGIQKNAADNSAFVVKDTLTAANKNSYSAIKKLVADSAAGVYKYRLLALDAAGIYVGSREIIVTVTSDFNYHTVRQLGVPDTIAKTNLAYFAATTGTAYSYSSAGTNTGLIDFGYYYDTTTANKHTIYALSAAQPLLSFYDIGNWTKNATIFKKITTPTFANITSSATLQSAGVANMSSGTSSKVTALVAGNIILFKTATGRYGVIQVNYTSADSPAASTFMNVDVKIQK